MFHFIQVFVRGRGFSEGERGSRDLSHWAGLGERPKSLDTRLHLPQVFIINQNILLKGRSTFVDFKSHLQRSKLSYTAITDIFVY